MWMGMRMQETHCLCGMQELLLAAIALCAANEDELHSMGASSLLDSAMMGSDDAVVVETGVTVQRTEQPRCLLCCIAMAA